MDEAMKNKNPKKTGGRRKIEIKKIENQSRRQVTFSKRRQGLFHKARDLSILCGAEVAILTFSPAGKVHCFGDDVLSTVNRYLSSDLPADQEPASVVDDDDDDEVYREYEKAVKEVEDEEKRSCQNSILVEEWKKEETSWWNDQNIDDMGLDDLDQYVKAIQQLQYNVRFRINQLLGGGASSGGA